MDARNMTMRAKLLLPKMVRATSSCLMWMLAVLHAATPEGTPLRDALLREAAQPSKPTWQPMLQYLAELHGRSVYPAQDYFPHAFESIGPGYQGGMVFGHIDL